MKKSTPSINNKMLIITLVLLLAAGFLYYKSTVPGVSPAVNEVSTVAPGDRKEAAFQDSQSVSDDTSVASIEDDLNNTVIQDEDFSDLE